MIQLEYAKTKAIIETLEITDQKTSGRVRFRLYPEQQRLLKSLHESRDVIVLKSRQIGSSTLCLAYTFVYAILNANQNIALVAHNFQTTKKLQDDLKSFFRQHNIRLLSDSANKLTLPNGTSIHTITAGAKTAGRSYTFSLIVCSEAAYYLDSFTVMTALLATKTSNAQVIIESTASAGDSHYRTSWESDFYTKFFSPFENHPSYKSSQPITDELFTDLKEQYGFTSREAASWWYSKLREIGNDVPKMLREYPLVPEQAFQAATGRWVQVDPRILPYRTHPIHPKLRLFEQYDDTKRYIVSVDTAAGGGGDDSVVIVYNCSVGTIAAQFVDNQTKIDELSRIAWCAATEWNAKSVIIEDNGIGEGTVIECQRLNLPVHRHSANNANRYIGFLWARNRIMEGLASDDHLRRNCMSCQVETSPKGTVSFTGEKDVLAALSFIGANLPLVEQVKSIPPPRVIGPNQFDAQKALNRAIKNNKRRNR